MKRRKRHISIKIQFKECFLVSLLFTGVFTIIYWPFIQSCCGFMGVHDTAFQFWPYFQYLASCIKSGTLPMWAFSVGLGNSFDITYISDISKFLISMAGALYGFDKIPAASFIIHALKVIGSGMFFWLFLKKISFNNWSALIGALLYAFSGIVIIRGTWIHFSTETFLFSILLFALERYFRENKYLLLIFSISSLFCFRGFYYVFLYSILLLGYASLRYYCFRPGQFGKYIMHCFGIWGMAVLFSSVFLLPNLLQTLNSGRGVSTAHSLDNICNKIFSIATQDRIISILDTFLSPAMNDIWSGSYYCPVGLDGPMFYCGNSIVLLFPQILGLKDKRLKRALSLVTSFIIIYFLFPGITFIFNLGISDYYFKLSTLWMLTFFLVVGVYVLNEVFEDRERINKKILYINFSFVFCYIIYAEFLSARYSLNTRLYGAMLAVLFTSIWFFILLIYKKSGQIKKIMLACIVFELILNHYPIIKNGAFRFSQIVLNEKNLYFGPYSKAINGIKNIENPNEFFRISKDFYLSLNIDSYSAEYPTEAVFYGYNGLEYLDSYTGKGYMDFCRKMGFDLQTNR